MARKKTTPAKTTPAKKTTAKKPAAKKTTAKSTAPKKLTKAQLMLRLSELASSEDQEINKKQVEAVFAALTEVIREQLQGEAGEITLPGLMKIRRHVRPARPAREGTDPRTREKRMFPPVPEKTVVKMRALKGLKEMVEE